MKKLFSRLLSPKPAAPIIVVSGLPRSGTSMMMKMLEAGGMTVVTDETREADSDNPKGYYEFERVKQLDKGDHDWLPAAQGKVVKVISALLEHLPDGYTYQIIFMERQIEEILASQRKMLVRRGEDPDKVDEAELTQLFGKHLQKVKTWLARQSNMRVLTIDYNQTLRDPVPQVEAINRFLVDSLDAQAMVGVVDPDLYRNRA